MHLVLTKAYRNYEISLYCAIEAILGICLQSRTYYFLTENLPNVVKVKEKKRVPITTKSGFSGIHSYLCLM